MFIGDAEQKATGISPASVKGALRFWWRALNWGRIYNNKNNDLKDALKELHEQEALLFGSSAYESTDKQRKKDKKPAIGASKFVLQLSTEKIKQSTLNGPSEGIKYLLGQGLYNFRDGVLRNSIEKGELHLKCIFNTHQSATQIKQLEEAMLLLGLLGGLGSRARKGFGSLSIQSINSKNYNAPTTKNEFKMLLREWSQGVTEPPFTAFSKDTKIDISLSGKDALKLLNEAGQEQQMYRSWGREMGGEHKVSGLVAEQNFPISHHLMQAVREGKQPDRIPDKAVFGLPQNYFFSSTRKNVEFTLSEKKRARRASPLLMHVHKFDSGESILIHLFLPARFLEDGANLEFKVDRKKKILKYKNTMTDWDVIHDYLDRFKQREVIV